MKGGIVLTQQQELDVIHRVLDGDVDAFENLIHAYEKNVYNIALRMVGSPEDAEDMAQEAFIKAFNALSSFREDSKFSSWLYRIVSNVCLDHLRAGKNKATVSLTVENEDGQSEELDLPDPTSSPEKILEGKMTVDAVRRGLRELPPDYRQVLLLREVQGLSYEEISDATGIEIGTVKSRIFRARKKLCAFLVRDGNIPDRYSSYTSEEGGKRR